LGRIRFVFLALALSGAVSASAEETRVFLFSQEPESTPNLISNPSFEDGFDGWSPSSRHQVSLHPGVRVEGQMSARLSRLGEEPVPQLTAEAQVSPGKLYEFGLFYRTERLRPDPDRAHNGLLVELAYKTVSLRRKPIEPLRLYSGEQSSNWIEVKQQFFVPRYRKKLRVTISAPCLSGQLWVDGVHLRECVVPKAESRLLVRHGELSFAEIDHGAAAGEPAELTEAQQKVGFVPFVAEDADAYRRHLRPSAAALKRPVRFAACPGEYEPGVFAVRTLAPLTDLHCRVTDLKSAAGQVIPRGQFELRIVQFRLCLTDYRLRDRAFRNVPELLEPAQPISLPGNTTQPYWLTLHVPEDAVPGEYRGEVKIEADGGRSSVLPLLVRVRPFRLEGPKDRVWALYVDSWRWAKRYPEDKDLLAEAKDIRAHGVRSLVLSASREFVRRDGSFAEWNDPNLTRALPLLREAGLDGPIVLGLGFLEELLTRGKLRGPTGEVPDWADFSWSLEIQNRYVDALRLVSREFETRRWPAFLFLGTEAVAGDRGNLSRARWEYQLARRAGLKSLFIGDPAFAREELAELLDIRCFDAGLAVNTGEHAAARFTECRAAGGKFWWRGVGSFNLHEGNLVRNRYLAGLLHYKSAADGCLIWTFQRPRGSAFNDFDGITNAPRFPKDCCLTYPSRESAENIPTPQWEGIREGIDDYRYAHTLDERLRAKIKSGDAKEKERAEKIRKAFRELLLDLPWAGERPFEGKVTVPALNAIRDRIASWIAELDGGVTPD